jgi:16S rRNA (cytidine1402-2'-O)-methyltransferase
MPGILYVVATPIGNLEDVTYRALRVLREVAVIAAEDTRRTARLLQHYSISTPTTSLHEHNERARSAALVARLQAGESVALVSDAGTPVISDPGVLLVAAAHGAGIRVEPVPGPSAAIAALSASGFASDQVIFGGFPPFRAGARKRWFAGFRDDPRCVVFYEAPHRIRASLQDLLAEVGDRRIAVARELTKTHEELVVSPISQYLSNMRDPRGEYTVVLEGRGDVISTPGCRVDPATLAAEFGVLTDLNHGTRRDAVRQLAEKYSIAPREMYRLLEEARRS